MGQSCCSFCRRKPPDPECEEEGWNGRERKVLDFVVALHSYRATANNELSFERGDKLEVINKDDEDWWLARYPQEAHAAYIPVPFVALSSSLESHEWYHGEMTRVEAEQLLMSSSNSPGAFLMRKSARANCYVLSFKAFQPDLYTPYIKHFNIVQTSDHYYVLADNCFLTLSDLVEYFITMMDKSLPPNMSKYPCARPPPTMQDISRETKEQWEIPREELQFVKKLGQGSFGDVWLGKWKGTISVAIKMMKKGKMNADDFLAEAKVMKSLRHTNILRLYAVCTKETPLLIVTEYMSEGALLDLLRKEHLVPQLQLHVASQVAAGMEYLENEQLIHRDLAARNILVGQCYVCKVADFGLSKIMEQAIYDDENMSKGRLPIKWTAPEAILHQKYSSKSDVWSFGVMMMEILTHGAVPYPGYSNKELIHDVSKGYRMPRPSGCPSKMYDIICSCWNKDPVQRPTFHALHDVLVNFDVQSDYDEQP